MFTTSTNLAVSGILATSRGATQDVVGQSSDDSNNHQRGDENYRWRLGHRPPRLICHLATSSFIHTHHFQHRVFIVMVVKIREDDERSLENAFESYSLHSNHEAAG